VRIFDDLTNSAMTETAKTILFLIAAAVAVGLTFVLKPAAPPRDALNDAGELFYPSFDPLEARSLEITRFDETSATPTVFKVAQVNGLWSLPSNENYPADAEKHLALAATSIMDVAKGSRVSDKAADHETYGLVDPAAAGVGGPGVGLRVRLADAQDKTLSEFIVGKPVKDAENQRFVRMPGKDSVYAAKMSTEKLSTNFSDWIEKDLLKINTADITGILLDGYSIDEVQGTVVPGDILDLTRDPATQAWSLKGIVEGELVNTTRMEEVRSSLADLKIVDVRRKPAGLSAELKAVDEMRLDAAAVQSLQSKGFFIAQGMLLSNEGEMHVNLKSGVRYVLRFGEVVSGDSASAETGGGLNRYLFITAQFDPNLVPGPALQPLPEIPATSQPASQPDGEATQPTTAPEDPTRALIEQARAKIEADNQKKQDEHQKRLTEGEKTVKDLNTRFADWYYIISDGVYKRLKITREEVLAPPAEPSPSGEMPMMIDEP
jgi:hypothetical protein